MKHKFLIIISFVSLIVFTGCEDLWDAAIDAATSNTEGALDLVESLQKGTVTYVIDGDTFDVELENGEVERVRPILVDAPEICHKSSPKDCEPEPFGEAATDFTRDLLSGETVYLEQDLSERDRFGRMLFYVYLEDGRMYQELILAEGLAEVAVYKPDVKYQDELESIELEAKNEKKNMWRDND
ncbi:thermonuclease family protein [Salipaludibacillus agaradhaerens]|jgi:micrococcal nuclease|uniref:thermonuclease family protein n=1 Tax=Salipaludibacillus agaradhaerens TaxID=76935 RepID=UPI002151BD56|nr:thermonuclease family protein [Salipaludibacillus agaradhaerens]MCR6108664.1 thermonuclease family protein [Salipaludibacillus agaradhaerens]MCR6120688.1 thermonuclease family protein [Salipaludibacillus agaradhaerens]